MPVVDPAIEAYTEAHSTPPPPLLVELAEETSRSLPSPGMMVGHVEGRFLELLVFATGARRVLEIGTFSGYSALSMAAGLPPDGRIVTCDIEPRHAEVARRFADRSGYADRIEIRVGPALDTLETLDGPFDLVFVDADKVNYTSYYEAVLPKLAERGLIVVDNTLWSGRVLEEADDSEDTVAIRAFNDRVRADPRVVCVQLPVRDGVTLVARR
ncbi:MAG TPA: class I SAM-dependent methyltransferase [Acidimicrobiales bacterium]|jgi:caffeoyl-CoA O-methyltransferase|nr:class I SAM-dependent methyltransferase [Acidimicrobiales bacterium]